MPKDIIVIGASSGGLEALRVLTGALPADLGITLHRDAHRAGTTRPAG